MRKIVIVSKDVATTKMMQRFGMFEDFKVIVMTPVVATVRDDFNLDALLKRSKEEPYQVILVLEGDKILYKDDTVKSVSSGVEWTTFDNLIKHLQG